LRVARAGVARPIERSGCCRLLPGLPALGELELHFGDGDRRRRAAIRYQPAAEESNRALADALSKMAAAASSRAMWTVTLKLQITHGNLPLRRLRTRTSSYVFDIPKEPGTTINVGWSSPFTPPGRTRRLRGSFRHSTWRCKRPLSVKIAHNNHHRVGPFRRSGVNRASRSDGSPGDRHLRDQLKTTIVWCSCARTGRSLVSLLDGSLA
jgi:hypothetical protein